MPSRLRVPRQSRSQQTVEAILEAAESLLEDDPSALTTARIADRAGVGVGSLYEYFRDKEAIAGVVMGRCAQRKLQRLLDELPQIQRLGVPEAIRRLVETYVGELARQRRLTRALLGRVVYLPADEEPSEVAAAFHGFLHGLLVAWRDQLRPVDLEIATFLLVRVLDSTINAVVLTRPEYLTNPAFVDELSTLLARYILPDAPAQQGRPARRPRSRSRG